MNVAGEIMICDVNSCDRYHQSTLMNIAIVAAKGSVESAVEVAAKDKFQCWGCLVESDTESGCVYCWCGIDVVCVWL